MRRLRAGVATAVWWLAVAAALLLAVGALLSNVVEDTENAVVQHVLDAAAVVAGPFNDLFQFYTGGAVRPRTHDVPREDLVNWGLAAIVYLIVGRLLDWLIRPRRDGSPSLPEPPAPVPDGRDGEAAGSEESPQSQ